MIVLALLLALVTSFGLNALLIRLGPQLGLVDHPNARKVHTHPTPKGGGLAIVAAFTVASLCDPETTLQDLALLGIGLAIALLGLLDDLSNLSWHLRLGIQTIGAACAAWWIGMEPPLAAVLATLWIIALTNAFNMLDNMDCLSAGVALIASATFAVLLKAHAGVAYLILNVALMSFLWFNRPPARIFMGDAGSTFLGFFLGVRSLADGFFNAESLPGWLFPFCVLAVPLYDQATVVALRLWQGRSPFHADKQHLSHRLVALGLSQPAAVGVILSLGLASGAVGIAITRLEETAAWVVFGGFVVGWLVVALVEYLPHYRK